VASARHRLREAGLCEVEADLSARLLAEHVLGWDATRFLTLGDSSEPPDFRDRYDQLVDRRAGREPLAYITGHREFWGLDLEVSSAVLIPRPETELVVEAALEIVKARSNAPRIVDACTGSGCIAVAIAHAAPTATVVATDISKVALAIARRNAERHGVAHRIQFVAGDLLRPIGERCDLIVANPPYVVDRAAPALQPEVRDHEPAVALFGGSDGVRVIARLIEDAPAHLISGGHLIFEFGLGQDEEVEQLVAESPDLRLIELRRDLQDIARTAIARRD